ncbi:hypothetical protein G6F40_017676 [Rhizopus arrhizus]|nr:hypothetical protein G6F40_017676 [Rhizopus arrhizus]
MICSLSVSLNLQLTLQNEAIWFVPASLVDSYVASGELMRVPMPVGGTDEPIGLLRRTDVALPPPWSGSIRGVQGRGPEPKPPAQCLNAARPDDFEGCGVR